MKISYFRFLYIAMRHVALHIQAAVLTAVKILVLGWPFLIGHSQGVWNDIRTGQEFLRAGDYLKALSLMNDAILRNPNSAQLFFLRGYAKYGLDDYLGAEQDYSRSIDIAPFAPEVFINRAEVRTRLADYYGALSDLSDAARIDSMNAEIYLARARIKFYLKRYYACIMDCNQAIRLDPENEVFYLVKGNAELELEREEDAMLSFRKALEVDPEGIYALLQIGSLFLEQEEADSSLIYFEKALNADPANIYARFNRSLARIKLKDMEGALEDLNGVIKSAPYNSYAYFNRALILMDQKKFREAVRDLDFVVRLNPNNITSLYYRGLLKAEIKDYQGALEDLNKTLDLFPGYGDAFYERSRVKIALKDREGALEDLRKAETYGQIRMNRPDSLITGNKDYLKSLVSLTGDFEEMNTPGSKFQNQSVDIQLLPQFTLFSGKADYSLVYLYDTYRKQHYYTTIIALTNRESILSDSVFALETIQQTKLMDSLGPHPESLMKRGVALTITGYPDKALPDLDSSIAMDPAFVLSYFSRGNARIEELKRLQRDMEYRQSITIGPDVAVFPADSVSSLITPTYERAIKDYTLSIGLDPDFYFAWYNRATAFAAKGEYLRAIDDLTEAIRLRKSFAEAYFNRALLLLILGQNQAACEDLSQAGELGIGDAYKVMKRYCFKDKQF